MIGIVRSYSIFQFSQKDIIQISVTKLTRSTGRLISDFGVVKFTNTHSTIPLKTPDRN